MTEPTSPFADGRVRGVVETPHLPRYFGGDISLAVAPARRRPKRRPSTQRLCKLNADGTACAHASMEPRIATLLGDSCLDRIALDPQLLLPPPPSVAPLRPHPVEPSAVNDDARTNAASRGTGLIGKDLYQSNSGQSQLPSIRPQTSVPIAGVLNNETPKQSSAQPVPLISTSSVTPFSGRLSDLLLDPSQQHANKRRKLDEQSTPPNGSGSDKLKLPKPTQLPKKTPKRPRIPPLLQGLHHPPPLPPKAFPPITGEGGGFGRDIGDRSGVRSPVAVERAQEKEFTDEVNSASRKDVPPDVPEKGKDKAKGAHEPTAASPSDKENGGTADIDATPSKSGKAKKSKKRNKWSDQETRDLLVGVSRFGIGNWKKILQCSDFSFNQRTAVDLKDRFRTCCPGEGLKLRKAKRKSDSQDYSSQDLAITPAPSSASTSRNSIGQEELQVDSVEATIGPRKSRAHKKGPAELAQMGIHAPFTKNTRRERCEFTDQDDENLLKGFDKYGSSWHSMRDDKDLGFCSRHPTDLRDRFRIRYPKKFAEAGYKVKPKDEILLKEKEKPTESKASADKTPPDPISCEKALESPNTREKPTMTDATPSDPPTSTSSNPSLRPLALREPLINSFPSPLEDFADLGSEDIDSSRSPVVLSRNIFQWADANPSQALATTSSLPTMSNFASDVPLSLFNGTDGMHIHPLATLNVPMALLTSTVLTATPSIPPPADAASTSRLSHLNPHITVVPAATTTINSSISASSAKQSANPLLRTPNLPTIVYPHVPVSSARSAMHNLPPPTDLLSGLDIEVRPDAQTAGFVLDDTTVFSLPSAAHGFDTSATLAPLMGNVNSRGLLSLDKAILDEALIDKRSLSSL